MQELTVDDIEALFVGAWMLGTGAGGAPYLALLNIRGWALWATRRHPGVRAAA